MPQVKGLLGRRTFLTWTGAASLAAGCSSRGLPERLLPSLAQGSEAAPGLPLRYRTACRECRAGCGVTATSREGRAIKLEGNPDDPIGQGALCARGQAAIQGLYHPARYQGPRRRVGGALTAVSWSEAEAAVLAALAEARARGPGRIRLVTRLEPGSAGRAQRAFLRATGATERDRVVLEPLDPAPLRAAAGALFGRPELPVLDLGAARSVVAFGADLLETWGSPVEQTRQLAGGRGLSGPDRIRLTWVGPRLSLTGVAADRWIRARAGGELAVALGVLRVVVERREGAADLAPEAAQLAGPLAALDPAALARRGGVAWSEIEALGLELLARRPSAVVGPGPAAQGPEATRLAAVLLLTNLVLGNLGRTLLLGLDAGEDVPSGGAEVEALVEDLAAGRVDVLLLHHADLAGALPAALGAAAALGRVPLVVSFAGRPDASSEHAHLVLPDHHPLESWGDVSPRRGVLQTLQPVMRPLADTRSASQVLLDLATRLPGAGAPPPGGLAALLAERLDAALPTPAGGGARWSAWQRGGVWWRAAPVTPSLRPGAAAPFLAPPGPAPVLDAGALELVPFPTALRAGGDLPWLREVPDALTSVSWSPWVELSPATASRLGVVTGQVVALASGAGSVELPAYVTPGIRDDAAGLPLGGPEWPALAPWLREPLSGALVLAGGPVTARPSPRPGGLPLLEGSPYQEGRSVVPVVSAAAPAIHRPARAEPGEPPPAADHRWAMTIDLDRCTGCQACAVACAAENNVPVMGPEAALQGRSMGWIRIERYLGERPGGELDVRLLPMLCQHCGSAPCEPVCPVYATYHTAEGLNAQVYNRCVGTRYCSNNCPYKVRTFNWRDALFERPLDLQLNPEVAVRSRGVMEKCTFCVQRIRVAEGRARTEGRPLVDGEVVPACAQTCPAQAIVFGDALDPASRVSRLAGDPRGFAVLEELGTRPAVTYLAAVRQRGTP